MLNTRAGLILITLSTLLMFAIPNLAYAQAKHSKAFDAPLFEQAIDYNAIDLIEGCTPRNPKRTTYHKCRDSRSIYEAAKKSALKKEQPLMVIFGFDTCPSCRQLESVLFSPKKAIMNKDFAHFISDKAAQNIQTQNKPLKISTVKIHIRNTHGAKLAEELGVTQLAKDRGWHRVWSPFIVLLDPKTGRIHSEEQWDAKDPYCYGYFSEIAVSLEELSYLKKGKVLKYRDKCTQDTALLK